MDICDVIGDYGKFQENIFWFGLVRGTFMGLHLVVSSFFVPEVAYWCGSNPASGVTGNTTTLVSERSSWNLSRDSRHLVEEGDFGRSACSRTLTTTAAVGDNRSFVPEVVTTTVSCETWNYGNSFAGHTLVQEWDLVCERAWMRSLVQSSLMTGMLIGCLICSALGDRLGRRPLLVSSCALINMAGLTTAAAPSFGVFLAARVLLGISLAVMQTTSFCLLVEVTGPKRRTQAAIAFTLGFALSLFLLPGTVWLIQHWRYVQVAITMPFIAIVVWSWYLPESPRWLVATGRTKEAASVVLRAASSNGIEIEDIDSALGQLRKKILQENEDAEKAHYLDLVREPRIRRYSVILVYSCVSCGAAFYGIQLSMTSLGGDPYVGFLLSGVGECAAVVLCYSTVRWFPRRMAVPAMYAGVALCSFGLGFIPRSLTWLRQVDGLVGKTLSGSAFTVTWLYAAEVFPTVLRTVGIGACLMSIRVGSALVPLLLETKRYTHESVPMAVLAAMYALAAVLVLLLPETFQVALPDTLRETLDLKKAKKAKAHPSSAELMDYKRVSAGEKENHGEP
uniref:MFS transporter, OCT family, solute carrier family 22 (Organic cation transporter), member 4/5 n=1 Tax=Rhipicephalus appendiculatus TaxID=34631 RepID=A0A131YU90_RHIAP